MNFNAYLIKANNSPSVNIGLGGGCLFMFSIIFLVIPVVEKIGFILAVSGILIALIAALAGGGKGAIEVDTERVSFNDDSIMIRSVVYPYNEISDLSFYYDSFYSQSSYGYFTENAGRIEYGMGNRLNFVYKGVSVQVSFFLANEFHANAFFLMLKQLELNRVFYTISFRQRG